MHRLLLSAIVLLATCSWATFTEAQQAASELLKEGVAAYNEGDYDSAEAILNASLQLNGDNKSMVGPSLEDQEIAWEYLGHIYEEKFLWEEAVDAYRQSLNFTKQVWGPDDDMTVWGEERLERAMEMLNPTASIFLARGIDAYELGNFENAEHLIKISLELSNDEKSTNGLSLVDQGNAWLHLGLTYEALFHWQTSEDAYKQALRIQVPHFGWNHEYANLTAFHLAGSLASRGQYAEAIELYRRVLTFEEQTLGPEHPSTLGTLNNLAVSLRSQGNYAEAEALQRKTLEIQERVLGPEHPDTLTSLNNLATSLSDQGQFAEAEALERKTLEIQRRVLGPEHPDTLMSLNNLATSLALQDQFAEAEALYRKTLETEERVLGPEHPSTLGTLNNLAVSLRSQGNYAEAEALNRKVLEIRERVLGPEHPDTLMSFNNRAYDLWIQGKYAAAEALQRKTLEIRERVLGPEHPDTLSSLNNLATSLLLQDQFAEAEALYRKTLETQERALGPEHPATLLSLNNLVNSLLSLDRASEALTYARRATDAGFEERSTHLPALWLVEQESGEALIGESFEVVQATQSSSAGEAISQLGARMASGTGELSELVRREQDLRNQIAAYNEAVLEALSKSVETPSIDDQLDNLILVLDELEDDTSVGESLAIYERALDELYEPGDSPEIRSKWTNLRSRLEELKEQLAATQAELDERFPDYANLVRPQPVGLSEIQELLSEEEALVVLDTDGKEEPGYLWVVTRDDAQWQRLDLSKRFWRWVKNIKDVQADWSETRQNQAWKTYRDTLGEMEDLIADKPDLVFVLSGQLSTIPPAMLITEAPIEGVQPSYLIDRHSITIMPSVTSLKTLRTNNNVTQAVNPLVGFADPQYDPTGEWENTSGDGEGGSRTLRTTRDLYENGKMDLEKLWSVDRLPDTADEIQAVRAILEGSEDDIYLGPAATETQIKQLSDLHDFDVVYLATHGLLASNSEEVLGFNPEPGLLMAGPEEATELDDGLLTASEAALLDLNANWVVLSACNTAGGDGRGEALSGLATAFFYAGAQSLVVSHWAVDSKATVPLMIEMFEAYSDGSSELSGAEALRQSMLAMKAQEEYRHPHFWAPFVLVGEPQ